MTRRLCVAWLAIMSGVTAAEQPAPFRPREDFVLPPSAEPIPIPDLPPPAEARPLPWPAIQASESDPPEPASILTLDEVLVALENLFPLLTAVEQERIIASGDVVSALGAFDLTLFADNVAVPHGFYQQNRMNAAAVQPLRTWGAEVFAGYKLGRGSYAPYLLDRETYDGGELSAGVKLPLLRDREIDKRRAALRQARIDRNRAEPVVATARIEFTRAAAQAYWNWLTAGESLAIARALLDLARVRDDAFRKQQGAGRRGAIDVVDNQRLIASRQAKVLAAEQKLQQSAVKLSLFLRNSNGLPILPRAERLPEAFPEPRTLEESQIQRDVEMALEQRPEIRTLGLDRSRLNIELQLARNQVLPSLDVVMKGSQDIGGDTKTRDKGKFELEAGFVFDLPLQRRVVRGKAMALQGKISQVTSKLQFVTDKIVAEVQDAVIGLQSSYEQFHQAVQALDAAKRVYQLERRRFDLGGSDILVLNLREQAVADAQQLEVEALSAYFAYDADYRAALGVGVGLEGADFADAPDASSEPNGFHAPRAPGEAVDGGSEEPPAEPNAAPRR